MQSRILDIIAASIILLLASPILTMVALLVRITSPGPAFYRQERIGKDGVRFGMVKFRTMHRNADEKLAVLLAKDPEMKAEWDQFQKIKNDPRITPIGHFLRKYSIDELPQLWNVLIGEMSLVGPRPFLPEQLEIYDQYDEYVRVLPGITGLWQVSGRNGTDFKGRAEWDEYYVRNWSVWLDLYILARTVWVVLRRDGAY